MKKILLYQPFKPFFITGLATLGIALFLYVMYPVAFFDFSGYGTRIELENYKVWLLISAFLFFLSLIYFVAYRSNLKAKTWLVILHYIFILLFLIFFIAFSLFGSKDFQEMIADIPLLVLISAYGLIFAIDAGLFALGLLLFLVNLFSLRKNTGS
jgi:hypothetical protein